MLSVVVPTLNEGRGVLASIDHLNKTPGVSQIVIVDASDEKDSIELLENVRGRAKVSIVKSDKRGRAVQMNLGADHCLGGILVFLHCDTRLPIEAGDLIEDALKNAKWGRFDLRLDQSGVSFRIIERMINLRSRVTNIATGDQAIFTTHDFFSQQKGFAEIELMEDIEFSRRLGKHWRPALITSPVITSARRWTSHGIFKTILLMWKLRFLYRLGYEPERLADMYYEQN